MVDGRPDSGSFVDRLVAPADDWTRSAVVLLLLLLATPPAGAGFEGLAPGVLPSLLRAIYVLLALAGLVVLGGLLGTRGRLTPRRYLALGAIYLGAVVSWAAVSVVIVRLLQAVIGMPIS